MDGGLQDLLMQTGEFVSLTASHQQINRTASDGDSLICDTIEETSFDTPDEEIKQPVAEDSVDMEDYIDVFNPYQFIGQLPPHEETLIKDKVCLPAIGYHHHSLPTLVLDLDETLVHCTVEPIQKPDLIFPVEYVTSNSLIVSTRRFKSSSIIRSSFINP